MSSDQSDQCVWILGLMHSGTTIVWRAFNRDPRFLGFDEPLTVPQHFNHGFSNSRDTLKEYSPLFEADPAAFWSRFSPIHPLQELDSDFTVQQIEYLKYLMEQASRVVINETHVHLHLRSLCNIVPNGHFVHLVRRASSFVTSHLSSSCSKNTSGARQAVQRLRRESNKRRFWTRRDFEPGLLRQAVIGNHKHSKFGLMLAGAGYDAGRIMGSSTLVRLLAYWHFHYHYLERHGPCLFGDRFISLQYEDFASRPNETMTGLYQWLGLELPSGVDYSDVHLPKPPYREQDKRWQEAARIAGFTEAELVTLL